jgi:spore coat protein U-like protein
MMFRHAGILVALGLFSTSAALAQGANTVSGQLQVKLLVTAACEVSGSTGSPGIGTAVLDFGTTSLLMQAVEADTGTSGVQALEVICNPDVAYTVTFDAGQNASQVADRAMRRDGGTELVNYQIYTDASRNTVMTSVSGVGTGTLQPIQVFGRVPVQTAPVPGNYSDIITVVVSF